MNSNGGDKLGYIVMPMDLTERQALIYLQLYKRCNFQDMTVKYTLEQLSNDIRIVDIPTKTIYKNIQNMISKGYIELIKKASKGNPPMYRILKMNEMLGEPKVNQRRTKGEPKHSNINGLNNNKENQGRIKGELKGYPIKEKEKEINNNISKDILCSTDIQQIINKWNSLELQKLRNIKSNTNRYKMLRARINEYGLEDILLAIENIDKSLFLKGSNKDNWIVTFDWFIKPNNFIKVLEGNYTTNTKEQKGEVEYNGNEPWYCKESL